MERDNPFYIKFTRLPPTPLRSNFTMMTFALWAAPAIAFMVCLIRSDLGRAVAGVARPVFLAWAAALRRRRIMPRRPVADRGEAPASAWELAG